MIRVLILFLLAFPMLAQAKSEAEYTAEWCGENGLTYDVPGDGSRPDALELTTITGRTVIADCIGENVVVEVDYADKFYEGLSQAELYGLLSGKTPILLLIVERLSDCRFVLETYWQAQVTKRRVGVAWTGLIDCKAAAESA